MKLSYELIHNFSMKSVRDFTRSYGAWNLGSSPELFLPSTRWNHTGTVLQELFRVVVQLPWSSNQKLRVNRPNDCMCFVQAGYVAHEVGHALGLFHEHQRPDRDNYISVVRQNIKTGQESNFSPVNSSFIEYLDVPYDLTSDMHYRAAVSRSLSHKLIIFSKCQMLL